MVTINRKKKAHVTKDHGRNPSKFSHSEAQKRNTVRRRKLQKPRLREELSTNLVPQKRKVASIRKPPNPANNS